MTAPQRITVYEDLLPLPQNIVGEILAGELHTHPRPTAAHARASSARGIRSSRPCGQRADGPAGFLSTRSLSPYPGTPCEVSATWLASGSPSVSTERIRVHPAF
jgi:hypothetical protein